MYAVEILLKRITIRIFDESKDRMSWILENPTDRFVLQDNSISEIIKVLEEARTAEESWRKRLADLYQEQK